MDLSNARYVYGLATTAAATSINVTGDFTIGIDQTSASLTSATSAYSLGGIIYGSGNSATITVSTGATTGTTFVTGNAQVETATAAGSVTGTGNASVVFTSTAVTGSPVTISVAVTSGDSAATWSGKVRTALAANTAIAAAFDISGETTPIAATGILTLTGNAIAAETVTIGAKTYTWRAAVTTTANEVKIGATASDSIDNLIAAVTAGAGSGTVYGSATTVNLTASASAGAGDTMTVTALTAGTSGNSIVTTETMANGSFGGGTLSGGAVGASTIIATRKSATILASAPVSYYSNDATLNISLDNGTCTGITTAASSANTTAGVATSGAYIIDGDGKDFEGTTLPTITAAYSLLIQCTSGDITPATTNFKSKMPSGGTTLVGCTTAVSALLDTLVITANSSNSSFTLTVLGS